MILSNAKSLAHLFYFQDLTYDSIIGHDALVCSQNVHIVSGSIFRTTEAIQKLELLIGRNWTDTVPCADELGIVLHRNPSAPKFGELAPIDGMETTLCMHIRSKYQVVEISCRSFHLEKVQLNHKHLSLELICSRLEPYPAESGAYYGAHPMCCIF